jgi:MFS transporter, DHA1 family, tetracycline resistance protein
MFYSQVGSFTGFMLMGFAMHLPHPLAWLFVARIVDGFSGGNITIAQAYVSDVTEPEERAKSFGMIIGVSFGLGFLMGPALGGFLSRFGYDVPAYVAAGFSFLSMTMTYFLLPETQHQRDEERRFGLRSYTRIFEYIKVTSLRTLLFIFFFFTLPFALYVSMFALYADRQLNFTAEQAGYFLASVGLLGIIWQGGVVGPLVKRLGERRALLTGLCSSVVGLFGLLFVDIWWKLFIVVFFFSFGTGVTRPALTSLITQNAPPNRRGGVLGVTSSIESFTRIIAPIMGGWIIGSLQPSWLGLFGGAFAFIAVLLALKVQES